MVAAETTDLCLQCSKNSTLSLVFFPDWTSPFSCTFCAGVILLRFPLWFPLQGPLGRVANPTPTLVLFLICCCHIGFQNTYLGRQICRILLALVDNLLLHPAPPKLPVLPCDQKLQGQWHSCRTLNLHDQLLTLVLCITCAEKPSVL